MRSMYSTQIKNLDFIIKETDNTLKYFKKGEFDYTTVFALTMLERLNFGSTGLKILMEKLSKNTKIEYSCGIIVRSVLSDYIILLSAIVILDKPYSKEKEKNEELDKFCLIMLSHSLDYAIKNIETYSDSTPKQRNELYTKLCKKYLDFFEPYTQAGVRPKYRYSPAKGTTKLYMGLKSIPSCKAEAKNAYDYFLYYSKYDHFGILSYEFSRTPMSNKLKILNASLNLFPRFLYYSLVLLHNCVPSDSFISQMTNKVELFNKNLHK